MISFHVLDLVKILNHSEEHEREQRYLCRFVVDVVVDDLRYTINLPKMLRKGVHNFFATFIEVLRDRLHGHDWELEPGVTCGDYLFGMLQNIIMDQSAGLRMFGSNNIKLDRMDGMNFTRWKEKMKFLLAAFKVYYVLEEPPILPMTEEEQRKRDQDDTLCRGYIPSTLIDRLYELYTPMTSAKEIWNSLQEKYTAKKEGADKFITFKFFEFTMEDDVSILDQVHEFLILETRIREKNLNGASSSKVNYVDSGKKNNKGNDKKRKGTWNSSKDNKKDKKPLSEVVCYKCGDKGHIKRYYKNPKKKNQNTNKNESANAVEQVDTTEIGSMVSEMNIGMIQELHMAITWQLFLKGMMKGCVVLSVLNEASCKDPVKPLSIEQVADRCHAPEDMASGIFDPLWVNGLICDVQLFESVKWVKIAKMENDQTGTRSALYANGRESITVTVQEVTPRSVGALIALYERAVGIYASLVNINAYHQPGRDSSLYLLLCCKDPVEPLTIEQVADRCHAPEDIEMVYKIIAHMAANDRAIIAEGDCDKRAKHVCTWPGHRTHVDEVDVFYTDLNSAICAYRRLTIYSKICEDQMMHTYTRAKLLYNDVKYPMIVKMVFHPEDPMRTNHVVMNGNWREFAGMFNYDT
ncbi:glucose-6-phosphate isomerase 1, chloroplastic [Artemisia annua]|uniref:Glucose-6-phosphate isomerase 1, chloroplastic n=1 Tax=Artemisia annua TaxID=35608 RepID=A0A2U1MAE1_ARTAN|nr:glucose-6-phosphate isomerase 1, chloroplastic [Artemisia annua]